MQSPKAMYHPSPVHLPPRAGASCEATSTQPPHFRGNRPSTTWHPTFPGAIIHLPLYMQCNERLNWLAHLRFPQLSLSGYYQAVSRPVSSRSTYTANITTIPSRRRGNRRLLPGHLSATTPTIHHSPSGSFCHEVLISPTTSICHIWASGTASSPNNTNNHTSEAATQAETITPNSTHIVETDDFLPFFTAPSLH